MGLVESAKFLASSPYIKNLAMLVIAYGMCINIVEVRVMVGLERSVVMIEDLYCIYLLSILREDCFLLHDHPRSLGKGS